MTNDENELRKISEILSAAKTIAVVGLSDNPMRTSREIAEFLHN